MDEKNNFDAAAVEFENVLALPENQQIIYKQFAVTSTDYAYIDDLESPDFDLELAQQLMDAIVNFLPSPLEVQAIQML